MATTQQPQIFYQPPVDPGAAPELAPIAGLSGPPSGPPPVFANAPQAPAASVSPIKTQIDETNTRLRKLQSMDANPYGSAHNHPGIGGKILHALSVAGNIAGDIFAPSVMERVPGTDANRQEQESGLSQRLTQLTQQESEDQARDATTAKTQEEAAEEPGKTQSEEQLQAAQAGNLNSETKAREHPADEWQPVAGILGQNGKPIEVNKRSGEYRYGGVDATQLKPPGAGNDFEQFYKDYLTDNNLPDSAHNRMRARTEWAAASQAPQRPAQVTVVVPDGQGGGRVETLHPGQSVAQGSMSATQLGGLNANSAKQDQAQQHARQEAQQDFQLAQTLAAHPSPTNDLALVMHYIGATKPDSLGKLRLNQNEISLVMGTRSGLGDIQALIQKAQNGQMLTPQQRTDMLSTMKLLAQDGQTPGDAGQPQRPANVPEGYVFKDGPKGKGWYKP